MHHTGMRRLPQDIRDFALRRQAGNPGKLLRRGSATFVLALSIGSLAQAQPTNEPTPSSPAAPVVRRATQGQLPTLGDGSDLGAAAERRMGDRIAREIYRDPDYLDDPILVDYVQSIWQPLLAAARNRGDISSELDQRFAWEIMLGRDRSINAFALPGGYLGLHLGLIGVVTSKDELAAVLAHELSHVTQRHISRLISKQGEQTPWLIGAMILGVLAAGKSPDAANALLAGGQAVALQNQLNFSRDMEREADRVGFGVMTEAGFAPQGFVSMFDKLQQAARLNDNGSFPYLRSHPLTTERIADVQARQSGIAKLPGADEPVLEHAMLSARARILSNPGVDVLRQSLVDASPAALAVLSPARQAAALYGAVLAATRLREPGAARLYLSRLTDLVRADPAAQRQSALLGAELATQSGQPVPSLPGRRRPEIMLSAQGQMQAGRADVAAQSLLAWLSTHPRDAAAWQLLASASAAQGQALRSLRAEAEARVAQLDYAAGLDRFKAAQLMARSGPATTADHIEASIIDTRTRLVQSLLREQSLER